MSRSKTCSYCRGDHAILDCEKLTRDGLKAIDIVENWTTGGAAEKHKNAILISSSYEYVRECLGGGESSYRYKKYDNAERAADYQTSHYIKGRSYQHGDNFYWTEDEFVEAFNALPDEIIPVSGEIDIYNEARVDARKSKTAYERTVKMYTRNEEAKHKRANKSCSYCKGLGHTVRTCSTKNADNDTYRDAYLIYAYLTARAASRFGTYTGSMLKQADKSEGRLFHWNTRANGGWSGKKLSMVISAAPSDQDEYAKAVKKYTEAGQHSYRYKEGVPTNATDYIDWTYLREYTQSSEYVIATKAYLHTNEYISYDERANLSVGWENLDFANDRIVFDKETDVHYPTRCPDLHERIFRSIMEDFREVKIPKRKGQLSDAEFCIRIADLENSWHPVNMSFEPTHYTANRVELFADKKQRSSDAWQAVAKFVDANQDILNKAESLIVK